MEFKYRAVDKEPTPYSSPYSVEEMEQDQGHFLIHDIVRRAIQSEPEMKKIRKEGNSERGGLALRERGGDETGLFHLETGVGINGRGLTVAEERSLVERIYMNVEERFAASLEKKIVAALEKRFAATLNKRIEMSLDRLLKLSAPGEHSLVPFGQLSLEKIEKVVLPPNEAGREEKQTVLMELPDANRCGEKRKAVSPVRQGVNESTSKFAKKMGKKAWTCGLCQVSATSKDGLDDHVRGKNHKLKEAASKLKNEVKDIDNGLLRPNKKAKGDTDVSGIKLKDVLPQEQAASEYTKSGDPKKSVIGDWNCELCQVSLTSKRVFDDHMQGKRHKSKEAALKLDTKRKHLNKSMPTKEAEQKSVGENDTSLLQGCVKIDSSEDDFKQHEKEGMPFWCKTCDVGANSEAVMETHRKGKRHVSKLHKAAAAAAATTKNLNNVVASNNADDPTKDGEVDEGVLDEEMMIMEAMVKEEVATNI